VTLTASELAEYGRQAYNAVGDTFFSDAEIYRYIWEAEAELATEAKLIERAYTTTTVASTAAYAAPTYAMVIKRVTYDSQKLMPISFREYDALVFNATTIPLGTPQYYVLWEDELTLYPTPDAAATLKIWSLNQPQQVTSTSALEVPGVWHLPMADFLLWKFAQKDKNFQAAANYQAAWAQTVQKAKKWNRTRVRGDSFTTVTDVDMVPQTVIGAI
jgi:hypothetical protein